tara:strand:+ start:358 stop:1122 length:765 start_codon:yes stop_codon:yes gene_type:complete
MVKQRSQVSYSFLRDSALSIAVVAATLTSASADPSAPAFSEKDCYSVIFDMISGPQSSNVSSQALSWALNLEKKVNENYDPTLSAAPEWCLDLKDQTEPTVETTSVATPYQWRNWSDQAIMNQGKDFRESAMAGQEYMGGENSARGAYDRFQHLCVAGQVEGCTYAVDTARELLRDKSLEIAFYEAGCENANPRFCGAGYMLTAFPSKPSYDRAKAEYFAEAGCDLSDAYLCEQVEWQKANPVLTERSARDYID